MRSKFLTDSLQNEPFSSCVREIRRLISTTEGEIHEEGVTQKARRLTAPLFARVSDFLNHQKSALNNLLLPQNGAAHESNDSSLRPTPSEGFSSFLTLSGSYRWLFDHGPASGMNQRSHVTLQNFFVFNPTLGHGEDEEHKKLLFYYPEDTPPDDQLRDVGIAQGLVNFTRQFSPDQPCEVMHTLKTRQMFLEAEPDFWIILTLSLPTQQRSKDLQPVIEYPTEDVQDAVYKAVLQRLYDLFRTFNSTLADILTEQGVDRLRKELDEHYSAALPRLKFQHCDILDIFQGVHFLPLDRPSFLQVHSFTSSLEQRFGAVKFTAFLCNDQLVWSGLPQKDMQMLYSYLLSNVLQGAVESELLSQNKGQTVNSRFLHGKPDEPAFLSEVPHMLVSGETFSLLIYRSLSATVCILLRPEDLTVAIAKQMEEFLATELKSLANDISKQYNKLTISRTSYQEPMCKYIYFNWMNIAQKSSIHAERKLGTSVPSSLIKLIADFHCDLAIQSDNDRPVDGEMIANTTAEDHWLVAKSWDSREFFIVLNNKNSNLSLISDEVKRLCNSQLQNIFFID